MFEKTSSSTFDDFSPKKPVSGQSTRPSAGGKLGAKKVAPAKSFFADFDLSDEDDKADEKDEKEEEEERQEETYVERRMNKKKKERRYLYILKINK